MKKFLFPLILLFGSFLWAQNGGPNIQNSTEPNIGHQPLSLLSDFTIDQDDFVNQCIAMVEENNIANTIITLENYGTRFHSKPSGVQASHDIKDWWQDLADTYERNDITVEAFNHSFSNQISVILTIPGNESPDEIVIIGGHLDSGDFWLQDNAPGADDNASGIATLTETLRVLLANDFQPKKTVQIMAYAAEEIGLNGSADIAQTYKNQSKNVLGVLQFDLTNYKGSDFDIALNNDAQYTSSELNLFLIDLLEHYNASGEHPISYDFSKCNYACSDHASWAQKGYKAAFPMESAFEDANPNIHTPNDTFAAMNNDASHSVKFVKLALEFVIETAKTIQLNTTEVNAPQLQVTVNQNKLLYKIDHFDSPLKSIVLIDTNGKRVLLTEQPDNQGEISMAGFPAGAYIAVFKAENGKSFSKKFLLR